MRLKQRVTLGFMGIVSILIISGMVSFLELRLLSRETNNIIETTHYTSSFSRKLFDALNSQNNAFIEMVAFNNSTMDSINFHSFETIDRVLAEIRRRDNTLEQFELIDNMMATTSAMKVLCEEFISQRDSLQRLNDARRLVQQSDTTATVQPLATPEQESIGEQHLSLDIYEQYQESYLRMSTIIKEYLSLSQQSLAPEAQQLHHNAYRAMTPMLISLLVMIVVVLMLYYFIMLTCVSPIVALNTSLKNFLSFKVAFAPKVYTRDEAEELKSGIESLINANKKEKTL